MPERSTRVEQRLLNAVNYPLCNPPVVLTTLTLIQIAAKERLLPGIVLHQRLNAIILGTSMSSSSLLVETMQSLAIA
jgi:hypothetical protein